MINTTKLHRVSHFKEAEKDVPPFTPVPVVESGSVPSQSIS